ncbi:hypothetical protein PBI_TREYKAY_72 [Mycobacterium phage TreyKay]|uniref:Uncharacterized protein n=1 Tax=Mycobacterium phage Prithvi TaxID=2484215 RepID=A0A3G3M2P9_9CAUD|nr:hypothetical protein I5H05_gp31 [Mycobacterium phage Prithvi]ASZ75141.1 hypothetical protein PBI_TREYKAY_72 [Mycobacterium phage TreyKay]AYR00334.1 hypothetical protein PBI_PRITHVI_72 [Mycobacterium phage Prithvi]
MYKIGAFSLVTSRQVPCVGLIWKNLYYSYCPRLWLILRRLAP